MKINEQAVLATLDKLAVLNNNGNDGTWGVLFDQFKHDGEIINNAFMYGKAKQTDEESFIINVSNFDLDFNPDKEFYSFAKEKYSKNTFGYSAKEFSDIFSNMYQKIISNNPDAKNHLILPFAKLINFLDKQLPNFSEMKRTRLIITSEMGLINNGETICCFDENKIFSHPALSKPRIVDKYSKIEDVIPGRLYIAEIVNETAEYVYVNVIEEYFKGVRIAIKRTIDNSGYFPESDRELYDFRLYPQDDILKIPMKSEDIFEFEPIHVDTTLLMDCLKLYVGFKHLELYLHSKNPYGPLLLRGIPEDEDYPLISCIIAPLDQRVRGGRR